MPEHIQRRAREAYRRFKDNPNHMRHRATDEWSDEFRACLGAWRVKIPRPKNQRVRDLRDPFA